MALAPKTITVGVDGSRTAMSSLRMAAMLAGHSDVLRVIHVVRHDSTNGNLILRKCEAGLRKFKHLNPANCTFDMIKLEGCSIADKLVQESNRVTAHAFLVMGAAGKGEQDSGQVHPPGQMPMGRVALECLTKTRCPIILTKNALHGTRCETDGAVATRSGRSPSKTDGLVFGVCVDGSNVSERALDVAVQFCNSTQDGREGATDDVLVLHAPMRSSGTGLTPNRRRSVGSTQSVEKAIRSRYEAECDRLQAEGAAARAAFKMVDRHHCEPIESALIEACEEEHVDVCFIGSTALAAADAKERLGSVSAALCKASISHVCVVKSDLL